MKNLSAVPAAGAGAGAGEIGGELAGIGEIGGGGLIDEGGLAAEEGSLLPGPNESYERQIDAIRSLVAEDPGRVAQVVKQWVSVDE